MEAQFNQLDLERQRTATSSITAGVVTSITITNAGTGYTNTSVPVVLIAPPSHNTEEVSVNTYSGDNGVIVGFGTLLLELEHNSSLIFIFHTILSLEILILQEQH